MPDFLVSKRNMTDVEAQKKAFQSETYQSIYQHPFWYYDLSMFFINQPLFLQKTKPLYPNPKYLFGIGI